MAVLSIRCFDFGCTHLHHVALLRPCPANRNDLTSENLSKESTETAWPTYADNAYTFMRITAIVS